MEGLIQEHDDVRGKYIYNLDESGCTTVQKPKKTKKQVGEITSRERGELVTLYGTISATGVALPPVLLFPRNNYFAELLNGALERYLGMVAKSPWMNSELFVRCRSR